MFPILYRLLRGSCAPLDLSEESSLRDEIAFEPVQYADEVKVGGEKRTGFVNGALIRQRSRGRGSEELSLELRTSAIFLPVYFSYDHDGSGGYLAFSQPPFSQAVAAQLGVDKATSLFESECRRLMELYADAQSELLRATKQIGADWDPTEHTLETKETREANACKNIVMENLDDDDFGIF